MEQFHDIQVALCIQRHHRDDPWMFEGLVAVGEQHLQFIGRNNRFCNNIPLPAGSSHGASNAAIERPVLPDPKAFNPELIIVPSEFDANVMDPLGRILNTSKTYRYLTSLLKELAKEICQDRLLMAHAGGYSTCTCRFAG